MNKYLLRFNSYHRILLCFMMLICLRSISFADDQQSELTTAKLSFIQEELNHGSNTMHTWHNSWIAGLSAITVGSAVPIAFVDHESRVDYYYGAGASAIGLVGFIFSPISVFRDHELLNEKISNAKTDDEKSKVLGEAELYLTRDADNQKQGIGWLNQSINVAFNLAAGLPLGFFYDRWISAITSVGAGIVLGEAIIFTQPTSIIAAQKKYKAGQYKFISNAEPTVSIQPIFANNSYGAMLRVNF